MNEIKYTKEVTYVFEYEDFQHVEYHYVDNIMNQRYRSFADNDGGGAPLLNIKGTNKPHQIIKPLLVGERVYYENEESKEKHAELIYYLPDINHYMKMDYMKDSEGGISLGLISNVTLLPA